MNIKRIIWGAFGYVYMLGTVFIKALLIPIAALIILDIIFAGQSERKSTGALVGLSVFIHTIIAITTHRIILLGPNSIPEWGVYIFRKREFYFVLHLIGLGILMILIGLIIILLSLLIPTSTTAFIAALVIYLLVSLYIVSRLSLVFPAIATDQNWSFFDSWKATRNHQFSMIMVVAIFPFIISIPEIILSYLPYMETLVSLLSAITTVLTVAALSVAFQVITEKPATTSISLEKQ